MSSRRRTAIRPGRRWRPRLRRRRRRADGVEVAGALSEMIKTTMPHEFPALASRAKVHLVDHGTELLKLFFDKGHAYAAQDSRRMGSTSGWGSASRRSVPAT